VLEILQKLPIDGFSVVVTVLFVLAFLLILIFRNKNRLPVSTPLAISLAVLAIFVLYVISAFLEMFSKAPFATSVEQWGQVGDFFGGMLNPVLAFASFMALLFTINIQTTQLKKSEDTIRKQDIQENKLAFERTFFELWGKLFDLKQLFDDKYSVVNKYCAGIGDYDPSAEAYEGGEESISQMLDRVYRDFVHEGIYQHPYYILFISILEFLEKSSTVTNNSHLTGDMLEFHKRILMSGVSQNFLQVYAFLHGYDRLNKGDTYQAGMITRLGLLEFLNVSKPIFCGQVEFHQVYRFHWNAYGANMLAIKKMRDCGVRELWLDRSNK